MNPLKNCLIRFSIKKFLLYSFFLFLEFHFISVIVLFEVAQFLIHRSLLNAQFISFLFQMIYCLGLNFYLKVLSIIFDFYEAFIIKLIIILLILNALIRVRYSH